MIEYVLSHFAGALLTVYAHAVHKNIQTAKSLHYPIDHTLRVIHRKDVESRRVGVVSTGLQSMGELACLAGLNSGDRDFRTHRSQALADRGTNPTIAASNGHDFAVEAEGILDK